MELFGAIDIGTNAVRLLIGSVMIENGHPFVKKISLTRVPLRLGEDVFTKGEISIKKEKEFIKTMSAFKMLMEVYGVKKYRACATSAMREAKNGLVLVKKIKEQAKVNIEIISGSEEADLIFSTVLTQDFLKYQSYLFIDVGGGSTELSLLKNGERIKSRSFKIGTIRSLKNKVKNKDWEEMLEWVKKIKAKEDNIEAIGTGGNINRIFKMSGNHYLEPVSVTQFVSLYSDLKSMTFQERMEKYKLKPDRADVIIPASEIYLKVMNEANIRQIVVPKLGLSDGIVLKLSGVELVSEI